MKLFNATYELATHNNLKRRYFVKQLQTKNKPKVTSDMLKKIDSNITLFGNDIKRGDILLLGLKINEINDKQLTYNFFYCTREELKELGNGYYYANETDNGIPKIVDKKLMIKFGKE